MIVGLAGRAGSGKSAVARTLAKRPDVAWIDLDAVAWSTYAPGTGVFRRLVERFGPAVVASDGTIDRSALGRVVFADDAAQRDLEQIVHPEVGTRLRTLLAAHRRSGTDVVVVEGAALAASAHVDREAFDLLLWLDAPKETRRARLRSAERESHVERGSEPALDSSVVRVDAREDIDHVASAVWTLIERHRSRRGGDG